MNITVILNGYKRGNNLNEQYEALQKQTVKPNEILLWYNNPGDSDPNYEIGTKIPTAYCTANQNTFVFLMMILSQEKNG